MAYRLVRGEFLLFNPNNPNGSGSEPDGDTIRFRPDNQALLENFNLEDPTKPRSAKFNVFGSTALRLEAIDALELHYANDKAQQEDAGARAARKFLLQEAGFQQVTFKDKPSSKIKQTVVKSAAPHPRKGYLLTRSVDVNQRPVCFVYAGTTNRPDGSEVFLDAPLLDKSINARLAKEGHIFPTFYRGLPTDLRNRIIALVDQAWYANKGIWPRDVSMTGATVSNLAQLEKLVLWPKLFRRLADYFLAGNQGLAKFDAWLRDPQGKRDDALWIASLAEFGNLHDVIKIAGNKITMKYWPEDLIIIPK
jgi:endonuclease YncB( thermonuclease family)